MGRRTMMEVSVLTTLVFWIASAMTLGLAVIVVTQRDVFRAAIALAGSFLGVGILYFVLNAEFVGVVQILVYVGAISVLMAFAVMFIQDIASGSRPSEGRIFAVVVAVLLFSAVVFTAYNSNWSSMDEINDPLALHALTDGYVEVGTGEDISILKNPPIDSDVVVVENGGVLVDSTGPIGVMLIREYMLAFEIIGLLLVATLIGGLLLMRDRSPENEPENGDASV
ncbi:MAG: NADH-quinone oxidoreductase subunit J [Chloroflexota bacterium]|nr:NADH-quinone oxidoreductase subunit J [Chloroflexota bacterium]